MKQRSRLEEAVLGGLIERGIEGYCCNATDLPGTPDIVFRDERAAIFVHGCFWHSHNQCPHSRRPSRNGDSWNFSLERVARRDREVLRALLADGWAYFVVWECAFRKCPERVLDGLQRALNERQRLVWCAPAPSGNSQRIA